MRRLSGFGSSVTKIISRPPARLFRTEARHGTVQYVRTIVQHDTGPAPQGGAIERSLASAKPFIEDLSSREREMPIAEEILFSPRKHCTPCLQDT
jgi:hypothetical protein